MTINKSFKEFTTVRVTYPRRFFSPDDQEWLSLIFARYTSLGFSVHYIPHDDDTQILEWIFQGQVEPQEIRALYEEAAEIFGHPDLLRFDEFAVDGLPDRDWLEYVYRANPPRHIGPFVVFDSDAAPEIDTETLVPLDITAATAFGSGAHGTTHGCLELLGDLKGQGFVPAKTLDIGTGSGILVIGAALLWEHTDLVATDNDPESLVVTGRHVTRNALNKDVTLILSEGFEDARIAQSGPYDLILANILPAPLVAMAGEIAQNCAVGGKIILSGIPKAEADRVSEAYLARSLQETDRKEIDNWASLLFSKT
ncbi:MAG: 50S ribosomal protein L11 methyltransferase [Pseudobdellovibrionaceae bacterium]